MWFGKQGEKKMKRVGLVGLWHRCMLNIQLHMCNFNMNCSQTGNPDHIFTRRESEGHFINLWLYKGKDFVHNNGVPSDFERLFYDISHQRCHIWTLGKTHRLPVHCCFGKTASVFMTHLNQKKKNESMNKESKQHFFSDILFSLSSDQTYVSQSGCSRLQSKRHQCDV